MVTAENYRKMALALPEAVEAPHFEKTSFRVNKKIFATYDEKHQRACLKLSLNDQHIYSLAANDAIYPVPNKWGGQGWTFVDIGKVKTSLFKEALHQAYRTVAPGRLSDRLKGKE